MILGCLKNRATTCIVCGDALKGGLAGFEIEPVRAPKRLKKIEV